MFWLIKQLERIKIVSFRHGGERGSGGSFGKEPLSHGWGGNGNRRAEALRKKKALAEEKRNHPYASRKFRGDKRRDLTPEEEKLLEEMKRGRSTG